MKSLVFLFAYVLCATAWGHQTFSGLAAISPEKTALNNAQQLAPTPPWLHKKELIIYPGEDTRINSL